MYEGHLTPERTRTHSTEIVESSTIECQTTLIECQWIQSDLLFFYGVIR